MRAIASLISVALALAASATAPGAAPASAAAPGAARARAAAVPGAATAGVAGYAAIQPDLVLRFPDDEGSHPEFRTEWWYVTGWLETPDHRPLGFQVTFFRTRPTLDTANPSAFAARQLLVGHAAVSDPDRGRLWHEQRIARAGFGLAAAAVGHTDLRMRDWMLSAAGTMLELRVTAQEFGYELKLERSQPPLANGRGGYSQKGPAPESASGYYSLPQLRVIGRVRRGGTTLPVTGTAWLDHEWSSTYLDADGVGWDWVGLNLADGGALMAFRIRDRQGRQRWAGGTLRRPDGSLVSFAPGEIAFEPGRRWRSPRTAVEYPVAWRLRAGALEVALEPLMDDQESDSRLTTGAIYWEGAVRACAAGRPLGRGYLELTGYGEPLRLR